MIDVIFLNGGSGNRINLGYPKQYALLKGKPIILYSLEILEQIEEINNIFVVCNDITKTINILKNYSLKKNYLFVQGGTNRQLSVLNGLKQIKTKFVLIVEAVRPFINVKFVKEIINTGSDIVVPFFPVTSSVIDVYGNTYNRNELGEVQYPQKYKIDILKESFKIGLDRDYNFTLFTDDSNQVIKTLPNIIPKIILGIKENIKITYPIDLKIAESILAFINGGSNE